MHFYRPYERNCNTLMKKIKFFASINKEKDWLSEMAAQGFLLADVSLGCVYYFEKSQPCDKVFEIDRFDVSSHATVRELNARNLTLDLAAASGWEVIAHDGDMNYYFIKDKSGDERDDLYHDSPLRQERAERFRKHYTAVAPISLLVEWLIVSVFCLLILSLMLPILSEVEPAIPVIFGLIYIITTITEIGSAFYNITLGQFLYHELSLSRREWELHKKCGVKKRFRTVGQLKAFLTEQSNAGLALTSYTDGHYLFEETDMRYDYYIDTKACQKKRMAQKKHSGGPSDLRWYEGSITDAAAYQLQPIGILLRNTLIYRRPHSEAPLPDENHKQSLYQSTPSLLGAVLIVGALLVGLFLGISAFHMGL